MFKKIEKDYLHCSVCGRFGRSGVAHIDRGQLTAYLCYSCAKEGSSLARLKELTASAWKKVLNLQMGYSLPRNGKDVAPKE